MNPRQQAFLEAYALCGNVARAAILAKVCRRSHYVWLRKPDYAEAFKEAHEDYCDALRSEIWKRAVGGVAEPVIYQGRLQFEPLRTKTGRIRVDKARTFTHSSRA